MRYTTGFLLLVTGCAGATGPGVANGELAIRRQHELGQRYRVTQESHMVALRPDGGEIDEHNSFIWEAVVVRTEGDWTVFRVRLLEHGGTNIHGARQPTIEGYEAEARVDARGEPVGEVRVAQNPGADPTLLPIYSATLRLALSPWVHRMDLAVGVPRVESEELRTLRGPPTTGRRETLLVGVDASNVAHYRQTFVAGQSREVTDAWVSKQDGFTGRMTHTTRADSAHGASRNTLHIRVSAVDASSANN